MPEFYISVGGGMALNGYVTLLLFAALAVAAYFCGCLNGAVIVSKYILRDDVRTHGSGNAGLTNFHRTFGGKWTAVVLLLDVIKTVVAVWLAAAVVACRVTPNWLPLLVGMRTASQEEWMAWLVLFAKYWAGLFCIIGHMFPCMFGFKGGKGILSGGTLLLVLGDWRIILVGWGGFLLLAVLTRWVSLGSTWAGLSFPFSTWFVYQDWRLTLIAVAVGGLIVWQHRGNIRRILKGEERKFSLHKKEK